MVNGGGTVFIGGQFGTLAGTLAPHIGMYFPLTNRFGTLIGRHDPAQRRRRVLHSRQNPNGTVFFGGQFTTIAGTTANHIGQYTGAFGTLTGGTLSPVGGVVLSLLYSPLGTLLIGGQFGTASGTRTGNIAMWNGAFGSYGGSVGADS
jgi:hypothetical protein